MATVNDPLRQQLAHCEQNWRRIVGENPEKDETHYLTSLGVLLGEENRRQFVNMLIAKYDENEHNAFLLHFVQYANYPVSKRASECDAGPSSPGKKEKLTKGNFAEWYELTNKKKPNTAITHLFAAPEGFLLLQTIEAFKTIFNDDEEATAFYSYLHPESNISSNAPSCSVDVELSMKAFDLTYDDPHGVVADFKKYVTTCQNNYRSNRYMAPYVSLCQSSGYGKSRLLKELANDTDVNLLYLAIGDSTQSYPVPNARAKTILFLPKERPEKERLNCLSEKLRRCFDVCVGEKLPENQFDSIDDTFWDKIAIEPASSASPAGTLWIAFDEARSLLQESDKNNNAINDFRLLRRALKQVHSSDRQIFAILVDTKSQIANFSPNHKLDASYRPSRGSLLFHPYILFATHDTLIKAGEMNFFDETSYLACGRPLWKALSQDTEMDIMSFAKEKILKDTCINEHDDSAMLALVLCRCGVFLSPQSSRAKDLAANYMATILLSDCTHERFLVTYFSDPVLSIAAASLWHTDALLESCILPALRRELTQGAVIEGYLGELVGQIILLIGIDTCQQSTAGVSTLGYDGKWRSLRDFMKNCFGVELESEKYKTAKVGFSHFIPSKVPPKTCQDLEQLLRRRGASCLPSCHRGADLLIPFWFEEIDNKKTVSYILIQIKNRKNKVCKEEICKKLHPHNVFPNKSALRSCASCIRILMEIGPVQGNCVEEYEDDDGNITYCRRGLAYPFLKGKAIVNELTSLLKGALDVDEWIENDNKYNEQMNLAENHATRKELLERIGFLPGK